MTGSNILSPGLSPASAANLDREMDKWKPIDTAPQNGTPVLLGWLRTWPKEEWVCEVNPAGNLDTGRQGTRYMHGQATHWMPLPEPPK